MRIVTRVVRAVTSRDGKQDNQDSRYLENQDGHQNDEDDYENGKDYPYNDYHNGWDFHKVSQPIPQF